MARRPISLYRDAFPARPVFDTAVSRALLEAAAAGEGPEAFRLFVPGRVLAFAARDAAHPGYPTAVAAARAAGFAPVERLAGGRAAVFHEHTLAFAWAVAEADPRRGIHARFREVSGMVAEALQALGVDARVGEVPGEYCPGEYSVNESGRRKLMGVGQRLVAGAAHLGGVIVVARPDLVNQALTPVYASLGLPWDPAATGAVGDTTPASNERVAAALVRVLAEHAEVTEAALPRAILERAETLAALASAAG